MSSFTSHEAAAAGMTCASCWDDVDESNYVEYRASSDGAWLPSGYCEMCIGVLQESQYHKYIEGLTKSTCKAEQRRLLDRGPPINVTDINALVCPNKGEVHSFWFSSDKSEHTAKLDGSLEGEEREKLWDEQKAFYINDEDDDEEGAAADVDAANARTEEG